MQAMKQKEKAFQALGKSTIMIKTNQEMKVECNYLKMIFVTDIDMLYII